MPSESDAVMCVVDELRVAASADLLFPIVCDVAKWPTHLNHYRFVRNRVSDDGETLVEMSANRPFGPVNWPTWWLSRMSADPALYSIRFSHVGGITKGMEVEWRLSPRENQTDVRLVHIWSGPAWPLVGKFAARRVIGPLFIHAIASRTLAGLAHVAESAFRRKEG